MTIKKRLYLSNILMIVVPIFVAIVVLVAGVLISLGVMSESAGRFFAQAELYDFQNDLSQKASYLLKETDTKKEQHAEGEIVKLLEKNNAQLRIYKGNQLIQILGGSEPENTETLLQTLSALGSEGSVSDGKTKIVSRDVKVNEQNYVLRLVSPQVLTDYSAYIDAAELIAAALLILVVVAVFFATRYLSHFVLRKIENSLEILTGGVSQIRDGNLDYRIVYDGKDEFTPVCQAFNEMAGKLKESIEQIQKHEKNRKELLAGISHDLRTPLTSINAYVGGIMDGVAKTPEKRQTYLEMIQKKAMEMEGMVQQLFLFSKLDLGEYPVHLRNIDLRMDLEELIQSNEVEYAEKGLKLQLEEGQEAVPSFADPSLLCNVFSNILSNSLKYKTKETGTLHISVKTEGETAVIIMEDDGPGVSKEELPKLFHTFYRCDPARRNPNNGSGLGLSICAKMVEGMGGTIRAESEEGQGLRIIIMLQGREILK